MTTSNPTEPLKEGTRVRILHSGFHRARIVEYRGPLGPNGARVYRVLVARKPSPMYIEVLEEQLEVLDGDDFRQPCEASGRIDLRLPSGLLFRDAVNILEAKFRAWPWENYDGVPPTDPHRLGAADIDRVYRLGARTPKRAYENMLRERGDAVSAYLAALPRALALEDDELRLTDVREPVVGLFDALMGVRSIKLAGATKLVAPFRPALLPVIDSVVERYYWYATSIATETSFRALQRASKEGAGAYVFALMGLVREDVRQVRATVDEVLRACADRPYASASRIRIVKSLIWYYYARGAAGGQGARVERRPPHSRDFGIDDRKPFRRGNHTKSLVRAYEVADQAPPIQAQGHGQLNGVQRSQVVGGREPTQESFGGGEMAGGHAHHLKHSSPQVRPKAAAEELETGKGKGAGANLLRENGL